MHYKYINEDEIEFRVEKKGIKELYLIGSFTNWVEVEEFKFEEKNDCFYLKKSVELFDLVGSSGYCEYYLWSKDKKKKVEIDKKYNKEYLFNNGYNKEFNYILFPKDIKRSEIKKLHEMCKKSFKIKGFSDEFEDSEELGNFRCVIKKDEKEVLFRSYHPLIPSYKNDYKLRDIELIRQETVRELIDYKGIKNIINLSDSYSEFEGHINGEKMSYYKKLWLLDNIHFVPISYDSSYYYPHVERSMEIYQYTFSQCIKKIIGIIAEEEGPFLIHCRLGSDRTGVVIAVLLLLSGHNRDYIESDYLKTNNMGIGQYRSFRLLEGALRKLFGDEYYINSVEKVKKYLLETGLDRKLLVEALKKLSIENLDEENEGLV